MEDFALSRASVHRYLKMPPAEPAHGRQAADG
jgi:hypothetical protein